MQGTLDAGHLPTQESTQASSSELVISDIRSKQYECHVDGHLWTPSGPAWDVPSTIVRRPQSTMSRDLSTRRGKSGRTTIFTKEPRPLLPTVQDVEDGSSEDIEDEVYEMPPDKSPLLPFHGETNVKDIVDVRRDDNSNELDGAPSPTTMRRSILEGQRERKHPRVVAFGFDEEVRHNIIVDGAVEGRDGAVEGRGKGRKQKSARGGVMEKNRTIRKEDILAQAENHLVTNLVCHSLREIALSRKVKSINYDEGFFLEYDTERKALTNLPQVLIDVSRVLDIPPQETMYNHRPLERERVVGIKLVIEESYEGHGQWRKSDLIVARIVSPRLDNGGKAQRELKGVSSSLRGTVASIRKLWLDMEKLEAVYGRADSTFIVCKLDDDDVKRNTVRVTTTDITDIMAAIKERAKYKEMTATGKHNEVSQDLDKLREQEHRVFRKNVVDKKFPQAKFADEDLTGVKVLAYGTGRDVVRMFVNSVSISYKLGTLSLC
ncbi:hypothetical protein CBR_g23451 [Chara braunii]|uniref:Uncharacterized protein n=1 Tax=Chara braunii TaxID=69332 RepID=A0A388L488_CHABU|nr:hypothetical protein CBR_g23451 [Chara braunii]|eukprot:GBG77125.1 hypothetical protein CBR_g23451 [Chara braunii]